MLDSALQNSTATRIYELAPTTANQRDEQARIQAENDGEDGQSAAPAAVSGAPLVAPAGIQAIQEQSQTGTARDARPGDPQVRTDQIFGLTGGLGADSARQNTGTTTARAGEEEAAPNTPAAALANARNASENGNAESDDPTALSPEEEKQVQELRARDTEVRRHEQAHKAVGGQYAGAISYEFQSGPDGQKYAVGGEVPIDTSAIPNDPQATIAKLNIVRRAALAPAEPSSQDRAVAAAATSKQAEARQELAEQRQAELQEALGGEEAETDATATDAPAAAALPPLPQLDGAQDGQSTTDQPDRPVAAAQAGADEDSDDSATGDDPAQAGAVARDDTSARPARQDGTEDGNDTAFAALGALGRDSDRSGQVNNLVEVIGQEVAQTVSPAAVTAAFGAAQGQEEDTVGALVTGTNGQATTEDANGQADDAPATQPGAIAAGRVLDPFA